MTSTIISTSTKCANFTLLEDGILKVQILDQSEIDLEESKKMYAVSKKMTNGKKFVVLIDARVEVNVSKESREFGTSPEALEHTVAQALLVNSLVNKFVGNFIIQFHKPIAKTKLFTDEREAMAWLKVQRKTF